MTTTHGVGFVHAELGRATMNLNDFDRLPEGCRLWIFPSELPLKSSHKDRIRERLASHATSWQSHGSPVDASFCIVHDRFLLVSAHSPGGVSGCSVDALMREVRSVGSEIGVNFLAGDLVFYRDARGEIHAVRFSAFPDLLETGRVTSETPVFDTTLQTLDRLREGHFEVPLQECWHARTFGLPVS